MIPSETMSEDAVVALPRRAPPTQGAPPSAGVNQTVAVSRQRIHDRMVRECEAMAQHALSAGIEVPNDLFDRYGTCLDGADGPAAEGAGGTLLARLAAIHAEFAKLIAPATPAAILLIRDEADRSPFLSSLGPVPITRHFLALSAISLFGLLAVSLSSAVNTENLHKSLLEISGYDLLVTETFLLAAASLGSCFANLQRLKSFVSAGTYDPKHQSTYWARWVMGVISGILMSQVLYSLLAGAQTEESSKWVSPALGEPALALLGGYSAELVHRTLNRIIVAIDTLLGGEPGKPAT